MRFKIDENLPEEIAHLLRARGHDAMTIVAQRMSGMSDVEVSRACTAEDRILVTLDLDFADIRTYPPKAHPGFVVLRLAHQDKLSVVSAMERALPEIDRHVWQHQLWIVEENRIRIRGED